MPPHVIDVPVPSQSRHMLLMCLYQVRKVSGPCVLGVSIFPLSTIFLLDFGNVQRVWYILFFIRRGTSNVVYV